MSPSPIRQHYEVEFIVQAAAFQLCVIIGNVVPSFEAEVVDQPCSGAFRVFESVSVSY